MVSKLLKHETTYYCSNCRMKQFELHSHCPFCGSFFSNYEDILIEQQAEEFINHIKDGGNSNENNICGRN